MKHLLDFFDADTSLRDEQTGVFPRPAPVQIEAVTRAYRAVLEASAERKFTLATVAAVRSLHGLRGGPNRAMVEAALDGRTDVTGIAGGGETDAGGDPIKVTVSLRERSPKQQAASDLSVERAFDALRPAVIRLDRVYPQLAPFLPRSSETRFRQEQVTR
jgi:hypothetical protein